MRPVKASGTASVSRSAGQVKGGRRALGADYNGRARVLGIPVGLALSTAAGLRVFVALLLTGLAGRFGYLPLAPGMSWIASDAVLLAFATATLLEIGGYYVPWLDNLLDMLATPAAITAGIVATAAGRRRSRSHWTPTATKDSS